MLKRKQGRTYLAFQFDATNVKLDHMAGFVAAGDSPPLATIFVPSLPRHEAVVSVVDGLLEGQQCVPLAQQAAHASRMGRLELPGMGGYGEAAGHGCGEEQGEQPGNRAMHSESAAL